MNQQQGIQQQQQQQTDNDKNSQIKRGDQSVHTM